MARTKAIFAWVYRLEGVLLVPQRSFQTVSDGDIGITVLGAHQRKEAKSLKILLETARKINSLTDFHRWLFREHGAYAMAVQVVRESGQVLGSY